MQEYTLHGLYGSPHLSGRAFFAYRSKLPTAEVIPEAQRGIARRYRFAKLAKPEKLTVRVFKVGERRLLVLRIGKWFVSSFTWETLTRKAAFGPWKRIDQVTLQKRWR